MKVAIRKIDRYHLEELELAVAEFLQPQNPAGKKEFNRLKRFFIKPNLLGAYGPEAAVTTHPLVLEAVIRYLLQNNKEVWIGDSPGGTVNVEQVWQKCGLKDLAERYPIKLINLSTHKFREISYRGYKIRLSEVIWDCEAVINIAKFKTHSLMAFTGAVKNLYGLVPGMIKSDYHRKYPGMREFAKMITAIYSIVKPCIYYNMIDGILGMDGAGPSAGNVRNFSLFMGSRSASALDYQASKLMGFKIQEVPYLFDALHSDGVLPSRVDIPHSFKHFILPEVDIKTVKISKDVMRFVPGIASYAIGKLFFFHPVVSDRCHKCGICVQSCPVNAIVYNSEGLPVVNPNKCIKCMCCHEMCPFQAIDIYKSPVARMIMR
ncbi:MAG: iron-sulfur cluster-binding protein [Candidatus Cloacimonetes bacterium HGW-Cloacimonetes-1]|jgi:uncharacterized protein (DUF362 family)/NAD-dependent dihydropyrimidine dehydrogenase PreA subunit|nr:MAG: iron-sulfur cluster-binding protein [Candidatus Cloacimonetes bacterium HGW-Cloacimonetes-1]